MRIQINRNSIVVFALYLFWFVYYYFGNNLITLSFIYASTDTILFLSAYFILHVKINRGHTAYAVNKLIVLLILIAILIGSIRAALFYFINPHFAQPVTIRVGFFLYVFVTTFLIVSAMTGILFLFALTEEKRKHEELVKEQRTVQLELLKNQLNPHFLFNSLNTLYSTIDSGNENARHILLKISDMLRYQLYECNHEKVTLEQELSYIQDYIAIQTLRIEAPLTIGLDRDTGANQALIPPLLIFPLIENAFKYVSHDKMAENWVKISFKKNVNSITFSVSNTFHKPDINNPMEESGIGLSNIRKRLNLLYQNPELISIDHSNEIFTVTLTIPI